MRALGRDWHAHGEEIIKRTRPKEAAAYFQAMLSAINMRALKKLSPAQLHTEPLSVTFGCVERVVRESAIEKAASQR